jgi:hypothetical protein
MCYLCKPTPNGAKAAKSIAAAAKVWKKKDQLPPVWGDGHDWTKPPARVESWTAKDFDRYQQWPAGHWPKPHTRLNTVGKMSQREELEAYEKAMAGNWGMLRPESGRGRYNPSGIWEVAATRPVEAVKAKKRRAA